MDAANAIARNIRECPCVVAISGPGGAGKTTLGKNLESHFGSRVCIAIDLDDYILPRIVKLEKGLMGYDPRLSRLADIRRDVLELLDSRPIFKSVYDPNTGTHPTKEKIDPRQIVVLAGGSALHDEVRDLADVTVFLDASEEVQLKTRLKRDTKVRGYTPEQVMANMGPLMKDYHRYLKSAAESASMFFDVDENHNMHLN